VDDKIPSVGGQPASPEQAQRRSNSLEPAGIPLDSKHVAWMDRLVEKRLSLVGGRASEARKHVNAEVLRRGLLEVLREAGLA
jgi:hypothetical protein